MCWIVPTWNWRTQLFFNNSVVWLGRAKLRADIHLLRLYSWQGCFCQTVEPLNLKGELGSAGFRQRLPSQSVSRWNRLSPRCDHIWHPVTLQLNEVITQDVIAALARDLTPLLTLDPCSLCLSITHSSSPFFYYRETLSEQEERGMMLKADLYYAVKARHCPFTLSAMCQYVTTEAH